MMTPLSPALISIFASLTHAVHTDTAAAKGSQVRKLEETEASLFHKKKQDCDLDDRARAQEGTGVAFSPVCCGVEASSSSSSSSFFFQEEEMKVTRVE